MVSYVPQVREEQMVRICLYVCMCGSTHDCGCVVDGIVLWQLYEYYYYYYREGLHMLKYLLKLMKRFMSHW